MFILKNLARKGLRNWNWNCIEKKELSPALSGSLLCQDINNHYAE